MKTSVIRYRVADFLRQHPPFDVFSLDDLLAFCGTGRVIFHEDDIYVYQKGDPRELLLWVIQQGRVEILDETSAGSQLRDVLGPGDILGLGGIRDAAEHPHTARTATEVILYSFDTAAFESLVEKYPEAARYLTAHVSATARHTKFLQAPSNRARLLTEKEKASWLNSATLPPEIPRRHSTVCAPESSVREAARQMAESKADIAVVTRADRHPLGLITALEIRDLMAKEATSADTQAELVMERRFRCSPPGLRTADYLLEMLRGRRQALVITADGTAETSLEGIVTDSDLGINCGRNPVLFMRQILAAETVVELSYLRLRAERFLADELAGPTVVDWFWQMFGELNTAIIERLVQMAEAEMAQTERPHAESTSCWLAFGKAGRREMLPPDGLVLGLVYVDSSEVAADYYPTLARKVDEKLKACGLVPGHSNPGQNVICRPLSEWKEIYAGLIQKPIENAIYKARDFFDFHVVCGDQSPYSELKRVIVEELGSNDAFIPVLANDTLASLPPLTFFQGLVIEADGAHKQTLDLEKTALNPIVDAARVFALAAGEAAIPNTLHRLEAAMRMLPLSASTFNDAADGLRIASYQHTLARFSQPDGGAIIQPARLGRFEQRLLKTSFDAVRRLLELTSKTFN